MTTGAVRSELGEQLKGRKPKKNPHCPVPGCKAQKPHLSEPTIAGIHHTFSKPETLAGWVKMSIAELGQSVEADIQAGRFFAYLTRWRQPEELYHRALYMLFLASQAEIEHIVSDALPNSFSAMWNKVNAAIYDGKGVHDKLLTGLKGEHFTPMDTLNSSAHASLAIIVTCIGFVRQVEFRTAVIDKHLKYWKSLCDRLNFIETMFKEGKSKVEVLAEFKKRHAFPQP